jgi:hypothetical protein
LKLIKKGVVTIVNVSEQSSTLPEINQIDIIDEANEVDLMHIGDQNYRDEVKGIVSSYKAEKVREVGMELNIVLNNDIPVYQRAARLAASEQKEERI